MGSSRAAGADHGGCRPGRCGRHAAPGQQPSLIGLLWTSDSSAIENVLFTLILPFPLWGASVGLATAAYYYRRRGRCTVCRKPQLT